MENLNKEELQKESEAFDRELEATADILDAAAEELLQDDAIKSALDDPDHDEAW